jgi:cytochrome c6
MQQKGEQIMKTFWLIVGVIMAVYCFAAVCNAQEPAQNDAGENLFRRHCAACHPNGGNIVNPKKALNKKDLEANGIKTEADIIKILRSGAAGMMKFNTETIPDADARKIAQYILTTFKQ